MRADGLTMHPLDRLKHDFLQHQRAKGLSPITVRHEEQALRLFIAKLKGKGFEHPRQVDQALFEAYKAELMTYVTRKGERLYVGTVRQRLFIVQKWFAFLKKRGDIAHDPAAFVQAPKRVKPLPRSVLRPEDIARVMAKADLKNPLGYRDRAAMELLYASGIRSRELRLLDVADVILEKKVIRVRHGKGGRERFVPITTQCCRFLERYIRDVRPELVSGLRPVGALRRGVGTAGARLFVGAHGGGLNGHAIAVRIKAYLRDAGFKRNVPPMHVFRHSVATHLLENGMDVRFVQSLLGHSNIRTTQIYTHVERKTLHEMIKRFHPRALSREPFVPFFREAVHGAA